MRIDWVRHGQVPGNRERRYVGSTDESLTEAGMAAARELSMERPQHVFVSPRRRCIETAELLYPECPMTIVEELAECDFGLFEYRNYKELSGNPDYQAWIDSGGTIGFPGGEDRATFTERCVKGFWRTVCMAEEQGLDHIALVVHGGTIMAVLDRLSDPHCDYFDWQCRNLEGYSCWLKEGRLSWIQRLSGESLPIQNQG